ncbi:uncharacterized protein L201_004114 [Kwoniella dendrophila CBS 6074]|uniref:tRNA dimethylallyltransferase n=1 Tax=Kwoniella dendrophila CBS 6074 TaxID=1295534 RepID=A0AAX4JVD0_9TREE
MSASTPAEKQRSIVAVIGTTGVGKSDLAVALAQSLKSFTNASSNSENASCRRQEKVRQFPAVVLSADSMQLYKGLDVITNKVTEEEKGGVEHWGLDMVSPGEGGSWEVGKWCNEADKKVASLPASTLPIICGGTHYFIQHYLFPPPELSFDRSESSSTSSKSAPTSTALRWTPPRPLPLIPQNIAPEMVRLLETFWTTKPEWPHGLMTQNGEGSTFEISSSNSSRPTLNDDAQLLALHHLLCAIDPKEGRRWHWRDGRKVRRSLERWWERGGSDDIPIAVKENVNSGDTKAGRQARFRTLIFWVYEPLETLRPRLDKRVDRMVENGLLREIAELRGIAKEIYGTTESTDHTEGIFQSIGYKEFASLALPQRDSLSDPAYKAALERTKLSTHQYAKSQLKWIKKQLLPAVKEAKELGGEVEVYVVNGGHKGIAPAVDILKVFMAQDELPKPEKIGHGDAQDLLELLNDPSTGRVPDTTDRQHINARRHCDACSLPGQPISLSLNEWDVHVKSRLHKRNANPVKRDKEEWIAQQKAEGERKRAEREKLKVELAELKLRPDQHDTIV